MQEKSVRHQAALRFAEDGIPVFPCLPGSKEPATSRGFYDATTDVEQIDRWWAEQDYNLAFSPHSVGWSIIDPDGPEGAAAWEALQQEHGPTETYTVATPRGGHHYYFEGDLPTTTWTPTNRRCLGEHIDTRGIGGYALLPPSVNEEGKPYVTVNPIDIRPVPDWAVAKLARSTDHLAAATEQPDLPASVDRVRNWLLDLVQRGDIAIEGRGGNHRTYQVACELHDLGLGPDASVQIIEEIWNPHCLPPWNHDELLEIVEHAHAYAQNDPGAYAVAPLSETLAPALDQLAQAPAVERPSRFKPRNIHEQLAGKPSDWLVKDVIPEKATVLMLGNSGSFKSFIAQDLLMSIAAADVLTFGVIPAQHGIVFYAAAEGRIDLETRRNTAWLLEHGRVAGDLENFYTMPAPHVISEADCQEFREMIRVVLRQGSTRIKAIVLDTAHKCMTGLDENSAKDCGLFTAFCDGLRDEFGCAVIVLHHYGKGGEDAGSRGSSALTAGFDSTLSVRRVGQSLAVEVRAVQHKDAEERRIPWTFEGLKVANSLVFRLTDQNAHKQFLDAANVFSHEKIAAALVHLKAIGEGNAVSTDVLASTILPPGANRTEEENLDARDRNARSLASLGRKDLAGYCVKRGRDLVWFIASEVATGVQAAISGEAIPAAAAE